MNSRNSTLVKDGPVSERIFLGNLWFANAILSFSMVFAEVIDFIICTSIHLECESMITRNMWPRIGPEKSKWTRLHGWVVHSHGWRGASGGTPRTSWQISHDWTNSSIALSIPGHHTYDLAKAFILLVPWCIVCSSRNTFDWHRSGMIILRHPCNTDNPSTWFWYGSNSFWPAGFSEPFKTHLLTWDKMGSFSAYFLISSASSLVVAKCSSRWIISSGRQSDDVLDGRGNLFNPSAWLLIYV